MYRRQVKKRIEYYISNCFGAEIIIMNKATLPSEKCQLYFDNDTENKKRRKKGYEEGTEKGRELWQKELEYLFIVFKDI